jgi:autotransporter-associated beta strand protein
MAAVCAAGTLFADSGTWTATTGGNWNDSASWDGGIIASNAGSTAFFNAGTGTINNDMADPALALLGLQFAGGGYTLAGGTITLDAAGFITVQGGTQTVSAPLSLSGGTAINVASAQTLALNGLLSGAGGVTVRGGRVVLGNAANAYAGATVLVTGILEVASVDALGDSSAAPANLVLGDGTFRYTGPSATLDRGFTIAPTNFGNRAAALSVTDPAATLTVAGKVTTPNGSFIKTGPGTLAFTYPGSQDIGKSRGPSNEGGLTLFDANGSAGTNGYALFTVDDGKLVLGTAGQTNTIVGVAWVGGRNNTSPRMEVLGGVTRVTTSWFTIGRGTGTAPYLARPSLYIGNGAYMEMHSLIFANANGAGGAFRCNPELAITGATLRVIGSCYFSESTLATSTVTVANNSLFQNDSSDPVQGMKISQMTGAKTDVIFDTASTGRVYQARVAKGSSLTVTGTSVFEMDTTPTNAPQPDLNVGKVLFNGGTLAQRTTQLSSDWFVAMTNILVGVNNMTLDVASHAWLDAPARVDATSPGGKLIKSGNGTLVIRPGMINVDVNAGRLGLFNESPQATNNYKGIVTLGSGASLELAASGAAGGMTLNLAGAPLTLTPHSLASNPDLWRFTERAMRRTDGILQLTPEVGTAGGIANAKGGAFLLRKQTVSGPWTVTYSYICWATGTDPADGFAFVLHNDPRGLAAIGAHGGNLGYADTTAAKITNSIAVGINVTGHQIRFGKQGSLIDTRGLPSALPKLGSTPLKTKFTVSYDGVGAITCLLDRPGAPTARYTFAVNIPTEVGANEAYLGFTAGTGSRYGQHSVTDVLFDNGTAVFPSYCRYGGCLNLGSSEALNASSSPSAQQRGFVLGTLAYADQSVVNVEAPAALVTAAPATTLPALTPADKAMWKLNQFANWKPDGRLAVSTNANNRPGSAFTTNYYPIAGSWTTRFGYDMGESSASPADYITYTIQNLTTNSTTHTPAPGFAVMWRYYENGTNTTSLRIFTNGVQVIATNNLAPVSLITKQHANMTVDYNAIAKTVTIITSQPVGAVTNVFTGIDMAAAVGATTAYLGFGAFTGGLNAENIISDFSFSSAAASAATGGTGYLAFDKLSGSGTLIKRGSAALGLMGDLDQPTSNLTVRLEQGGLVLRKNNLEPLAVSGARSDWVFTPEGKWGDDGTLQFCTMAVNSTGTATSSRRVRVNEPWTITYSFLFGAKSNPPADAYSLFFHNDPRGPGAVGGATLEAGYSGAGAVVNSVGLRWYFFNGHTGAASNKVAIGRGGVWNVGSYQSYLPVVLANGITDVAITYDPVAATLTAALKQGLYGATNVFTGVNIPTDVGSDFAYLAFGGGCGGSSAEMRVRDFTMTYGTALGDTVADQTYLANVILPAASTNTVTLDTSIPAGAFKIAAANIGDGATFGLAAALQPGTLTISSVTQAADATYPVSAGCTLALANVSGGATLAKTGAGTLALLGTTATYTGDTLLSAGTLSLPAALLPATTDLYVTPGATLNLAFTGSQHIHALFVDGAPMPGGRYTASNAAWITGDGTLVVTYPPVGSLIQVK